MKSSLIFNVNVLFGQHESQENETNNADSKLVTITLCSESHLKLNFPANISLNNIVASTNVTILVYNEGDCKFNVCTIRTWSESLGKYQKFIYWYFIEAIPSLVNQTLNSYHCLDNRVNRLKLRSQMKHYLHNFCLHCLQIL